MAKIDGFTKENLRQFRKDFASITSLIEQDYGIKISLGSIRFTHGTARTSIEMATHTHLTQSASPVEGQITVGTRFTLNRSVYRVIDIKPGRTIKYIAAGPKGGRWRVKREDILAGLIG